MRNQNVVETMLNVLENEKKDFEKCFEEETFLHGRTAKATYFCTKLTDLMNRINTLRWVLEKQETI
jgi:hypothetical protein